MTYNGEALAMKGHWKNRLPELPLIEKPKMKINTKANY